MSQIIDPQEKLQQWVLENTPEVADSSKIYGAISVGDQEGRIEARNRIDRFHEALEEISTGNEVAELNDNGLKEYIVGGAYIRELFMPAGMFIVSRIWKQSRFWIVPFGEMTFTTEMGTQRIAGPYRGELLPGSKAAIYTHQDTLIFAITGTKSQHLSEMEDEVTTMDYRDCEYPWNYLEGGDLWHG
jgi:hypothetical protein